MDDIAIRVEGLSKRYRIQQGARAHYSTLRDTLVEAVRAPFRRKSCRDSAGNDSYIWALKGVSFEVKRGEVVGIIGRNGAGKTTLLKILSRITEPTEGYAEVHGRVGSLLEVGTGFHPELTGRENIYLNGAILGMKKAEIDRKFDEIVAFAEVEKFIDTPVKFYSSGMYVRLAFAVAAHLDPEILLVDEVLAVGDAAFQKKCLGKMEEMAAGGRTVLFVSHNLSAVGRLCPKAMWLDGGVLVKLSDSPSVIAKYLSSLQSGVTHRSWNIEEAPGDEYMRVISVSLLDADGTPQGLFYQDRPIVVSITYQVLKPMMNANVGFEIRSEDGTTVFASFDADNPAWSGRGRSPGIYCAKCEIPAHFLNQGRYFLTLSAGIPHFKVCVRAEDVICFDVEQSLKGEGPSGRMGARRPGVVAPELRWAIHRMS
jgi:lipopolysaccharide transport system ATP-binding protein